MREAGLHPLEARRVIEARLGREPQDMLEAAVVLEAWAGLPAQAALDTARRMMHTLPVGGRASTGRVFASRPREGSLVEDVAFVLTTLAIAGWTAPLAADVGAAAVEQALTLALPVTLALQWLLQSRYLGRPGGLVLLGRRRRALGAAAVAIVLLPAAALGQAGLVAGLLTLTWLCGPIVLRRRWTGAFAAYMLLGTVEMHAGLPALPVLGGMTAAALLAAAMAFRGPAPKRAPRPGRGDAAAWAAAVGAGLGLMLVSDTSVSWTDGAVPALALLPASVGGLWAGRHLELLTDAIVHGLAGVPVGARERGGVAPPVRLLAGAVWRLAVATTGISAALLLFTPWLGEPATATPVLAGFGLVALTMLLVGLLLSTGRGPVALVAVTLAVALETVLALLEAPPFPGAALLVASAVAVAILLPAAVALLQRPAQTLATTLWIA